MAAVQVKITLLVICLMVSTIAAHAQVYQRIHQRVERRDVVGERFELASLKGATLYTARKFVANERVPLMIHFHGASWLIEHHIAEHAPNTALITVNLGSGSRVYGIPFERAETFSEMIVEAQKLLGLRREFSSITLSGFSAGYGSIRAILRHPEHFNRVNSVLLLDGLHASYVPEGVSLANGGKIKMDDINSYIEFAREAATGQKRFVVTHSQIEPKAYVSTTEAADALLASVKIRRKNRVATGPNGMRQLSYAKRGKFFVRGYAGDTAADHVDFLHAMPAWFELLKVR